MGDATRGEAAPAVEAASGKGVALAVKKAAERVPTPENQAALAVLELIDGHPENAVPRLREAHSKKPSDPRFLNDLAVASLAIYDNTGDPWAALEAVDAAVQADHLEPSAPARFNLALALERLNIRARAIAAWERYRDLDSSSSWAEEAEQRLSDLKATVAKAQANPQLLTTPAANVTDFPDNPWARRQLGERVLLTRWAERTLAGHLADAEAALEQAEKLAAHLSPDGGRLLVASLRAIRDAEQSGDHVRLELLAHGHQAFGQAFLRWREERATDARALIDIAVRDLHYAKTPFELRARVLRAWMVEEPDWNELQQISEEAEAGGFAAIVAEERRIVGYRITLEGRMETASDVYQDSEERYKAIDEREMAAVVSILRTEQLTDLRRDRESSAELAAALKAGPSLVDPWDRQSIYTVAASAASVWLSRAAVELRLEAADACRGLPERPLCLVDSWLQVVSLTPDLEVAENALQRAEELLPKAPPSDGKMRTELDLTVARARALGRDGRPESDLEEAINLYVDAAEHYEDRKLAVSSADARISCAKLLKKLGRTREAITEYRSALKTFRLWDQSDRFRPERAEKSSPTVLHDAYEGLISAELDSVGNKTSRAAFLLSEEMRDRLAPRRPCSPKVEDKLPAQTDISLFTRAVPPRTAVVEYAIFEDRAAAWILVNGDLEQIKLTLPEKLGERVRLLASERNLDSWKHESRVLFESFLAPVLEHLPGGTERLVLVPDSQLYGVPFRALWDPKTNRYLDEIYTISLSPSVNYFLGTIARKSATSGGRLEVVSLGFQEFLPDLHLMGLPRSGQEAASVLNVYGFRSSLCSISDWEGFRRCVPSADVIHLATHATANSSVGQGWIAFPGEAVSIEQLWRELPDLPRRPVVVLSACQSSVAANGGEGLGGLARPFLASGARSVVGTLWSVDDATVVKYFIAFHAAYRSIKDVPSALREARGKVGGWRSEPWEWSGIEVVEGGRITSEDDRQSGG